MERTELRSKCGTVANARGKHIALLSDITIHIIYAIAFKELQTSWVSNTSFRIVFKHHIFKLVVLCCSMNIYILNGL